MHIQPRFELRVTHRARFIKETLRNIQSRLQSSITEEERQRLILRSEYYQGQWRSLADVVDMAVGPEEAFRLLRDFEVRYDVRHLHR